MQNRFRGLPITLAAVGLGLLLTFTGAARAQSPVRQHGYEHGYRDGYDHGREVRANGWALDFQTEAYRRADNGWEPYFGPREVFRDGYREGYRAGAQDGYNSVRSRLELFFGRRSQEQHYGAGAGRSWNLRDVAGDMGYRDGVNAGLRDYRDEQEFSPQEHGAWKDGLHGYTYSMGDREDYRQAYRAAFINGYRHSYGDQR
jgi:hypothetical protein